MRITGTDTEPRPWWPPACRRPGRCGTRPTSRRSWITDPEATTTAPIRLHPRTRRSHRRALPGHAARLHRVELRRRRPHQRRHRLGRRARHLRARGRRPGHHAGRSTATRATPTPRSAPSATTTAPAATFGDTSVPATSSDDGHGDRVRRDRRGRPEQAGDRGHQQGDHGQDRRVSWSPAAAKLTKAKVYTITAAAARTWWPSRTSPRRRPTRSATSMPAMSVSVIVPGSEADAVRGPSCVAGATRGRRARHGAGRRSARRPDPVVPGVDRGRPGPCTWATFAGWWAAIAGRGHGPTQAMGEMPGEPARRANRRLVYGGCSTASSASSRRRPKRHRDLDVGRRRTRPARRSRHDEPRTSWRSTASTRSSPVHGTAADRRQRSAIDGIDEIFLMIANRGSGGPGNERATPCISHATDRRGGVVR